MTFDKKAKKHQENHILKLKSRTDPQVFEIEGVKITVNPDVFAPASDTRLLAKHIRVKPGDKVLDLTTGAGILAAIAAQQGAEVTAVDINPVAVRNAKENFDELGLSVTLLVSDLFSNIPAEKFDHIIANGPFFEGEVIDPLEYASLGVSNFLNRLFKDLDRYLSNSGRLLTTFAEFGEIELFYRTLDKYGFRYSKIDSRTSSDGDRTYNLYEVTIKK
jgi:release factor glutamine methyltransferase